MPREPSGTSSAASRDLRSWPMKRTFRKDLSRRLIDALSTAAIKRGIGPSQRYLLTVVGRKTHTPHTTPVSVVRPIE